MSCVYACMYVRTHVCICPLCVRVTHVYIDELVSGIVEKKRRTRGLKNQSSYERFEKFRIEKERGGGEGIDTRSLLGCRKAGTSGRVNGRFPRCVVKKCVTKRSPQRISPVGRVCLLSKVLIRHRSRLILSRGSPGIYARAKRIPVFWHEL